MIYRFTLNFRRTTIRELANTLQAFRQRNLPSPEQDPNMPYYRVVVFGLILYLSL